MMRVNVTRIGHTLISFANVRPRSSERSWRAKRIDDKTARGTAEQGRMETGNSAASAGSLLAFVAASFAIELTPGPNMAYLAVLSASKGRRAGFAATFGVALGLLIVGIAAAIGLTAIIANSRWLYEALRWAGILYLLWLAWEGWRGEKETSPGHTDLAIRDSRFFMRGLMTNLLNPKAGVFYMAILPTFVDGTRPLVPQTVTLVVIYVTVATAIHSGIVLLASAARPWLEDDRRSTVIRRVLSVILVGIAVWLFMATRR
jgi:threonine/homoserine/homoserine lactone efflux protein